MKGQLLGILLNESVLVHCLNVREEKEMYTSPSGNEAS